MYLSDTSCKSFNHEIMSFWILFFIESYSSYVCGTVVHTVQRLIFEKYVFCLWSNKLTSSRIFWDVTFACHPWCIIPKLSCVIFLCHVYAQCKSHAIYLGYVLNWSYNCIYWCMSQFQFFLKGHCFKIYRAVFLDN